jgi:hypothetical protein
VSVCSVALSSPGADLHPYGEATHAINLLEGFESLDVVGNFLPEPTSFGPSYGDYAFTLSDPATGRVVETFLMARLPGGDDWAGSFSPGVKTIVPGPVRVQPVPAGSPAGPFGPVVIAGDLRRCRRG